MLQSVRRDGTNDVALPTMPRKQEYVVQAYPVPKECSEASNTLQSAPAGNGNEPINPRKLVQMLDQVRCSEHASIAELEKVRNNYAKVVHDLQRRDKLFAELHPALHNTVRRMEEGSIETWHRARCQCF